MEKINKQDFKGPIIGFASLGTLLLLNYVCIWLGYDLGIGTAIWDFSWLFAPIITMIIAVNLGKYRGHYVYLKQKAGGDTWNEHPNNAWLHILLTLTNWHIIGNPLQPLFILCMWSFFHDGMQYKTIDTLVPGTYPKRWLDFTKTPKSFMDKLFGNVGSRVLLAVFGLLCYAGYQIYYAH